MGTACARARAGRRRGALFWPAILVTWLLLGLAAGVLPAAPAQAAAQVALVINGSSVSADVPPQILAGRTMVPIRIVSENLGASVAWSAETRTVTIVRGFRRVHLEVGRTEASIDGRTVALDVPPVIRDGRTLVPLRFVGEALGAEVAWNEATRTVSVTQRGYSLVDISLSADPDVGRVRLHLSGPAEFQVQSLDADGSQPVRIVVDLYNTEVALPVREFPVGLAGVVRGRAAPLSAEPSTARVVLELSEPVTYRAVRAENGRDVVLEFAYKVTGLHYGYTEDGQAIFIEANGPVQPSAFTLSNPPRIVVDIPNATASRRLPAELAVNDGVVRRLRSGQFEPTVVRTVIDLDSNRGYTLRSWGNQTVIYPHRRITGVSWSVHDGRARVEISGDLPLGYRLSRTDRGVRVIVPYAELALDKPVRPNTPLIDAIDVRQVTLDGAPAVEVTVAVPTYTGHQVISPPAARVVALELSTSVLAGRVVVVDPGHGGKDPGSTGYSGVFEKEVVLQIATLLRKLLTDAGARVVMTRTDDRWIDLYERAAIANASGGHAFVSIHANAYQNPSLAGLEVYHYPGSDTGRTLAELVHQELLRELGRPDRGVRTANFVVLRETRMPAVLVETGYLTNPTEESLLTNPDVQLRIAEAIYRALVRYFQ